MRFVLFEAGRHVISHQITSLHVTSRAYNYAGSEVDLPRIDEIRTPPPRCQNFPTSRILPKLPDNTLRFSQVLHKTIFVVPSCFRHRHFGPRNEMILMVRRSEVEQTELDFRCHHRLVSTISTTSCFLPYTFSSLEAFPD